MADSDVVLDEGGAPLGEKGASSPPSPSSLPSPPAEKGRPRWWWRLLFSALVLSLALLVTWWMIATPPRARRRRPSRRATLVRVMQVQPTSQRVMIVARGTVRAAQEITLQPRVRGRVVALHRRFLPGGYVRKRQILLRIDARDYRLAVQQSKSKVAQARSERALESGRQAIAKKEYAMLGNRAEGKSRALMLRLPQLQAAQALLQAAEAALAKARLDLRRTTLRAPFNAVVLSRQVDLGSQVTEASQLARLVGTDASWIEISLPVDRLRWLNIPRQQGEPASPVKITNPGVWKKGERRQGRILRLLPALEEQGRLARLLVQVQDPLALQPKNKDKPLLLLGSYVEARLQGRLLSSVFALKRNLVHDGNRVWVMTRAGKLDIRPVNIAFRGQKRLLISSGLRPGERIVTTNLSTPVQGMPLRLARSGKRPAPPRRGRP